MSDLMQMRALIIKKMNVMVRKIDGVTSFVLTGNDETTPEELFFVVGAADPSDGKKVHADLHFLIREFLRPIDIQENETDGRTVVNYLFDNGLKVQVNICSEDAFPAFGWWVPYFDKNGAVLRAYSPASRKSADPTTEKPLPAEGDSLEDDFDDSAAAPQEAADPAPSPAPAPEPEPEPAPSERELWNYFYDRVNVAKHAISGGSLIYAGEIIGELRTLLIRLMCEAEGITEDYLHSIDLLPEGYRKALAKTYPTGLENARMISALAAEHSIFERLMKMSGR